MACIFCEIVEGRRPSRTVYADDQVVDSVYHIHLHLLGGRALGWPPG